MMRGVALRDLGRPADALADFTHARAALQAEAALLEAAAARFNEGLARRDVGHLDEAADCFIDAHAEFVAAGARGQAAAANRELGNVRLAGGDPAAAVAPLEQARDDALAVEDRIGAGAAANALGLALLALGDADGARRAFEDAAAAHPRAVRPAEHAMAKANLALAWEALDEPARARIAARQARATPAAAAEVVAQAGDVLTRLDEPAGLAGGDLVAVLAGADMSVAIPVIRDEAARLLDLEPSSRADEVAQFLEALADGADDPTEILAAWLEVALEVPPAQMDALLAPLVAGIDVSPDRDRLRAATSRALVRFAPPQMLRLDAALRHNHGDPEPAWP